MGSWGIGFFENDDATTFLDVIHNEDFSIENEVNSFTGWQADIEPERTSNFLALLELLAFLWGRPMRNYPNEFNLFSPMPSASNLNKIHRLALKCLSSFLNSQHYADISKSSSEFCILVSDLQKRLASKAKRIEKEKKRSNLFLVKSKVPYNVQSYKISNLYHLEEEMKDRKIKHLALNIDNEEYLLEELEIIYQALKNRCDIGIEIHNKGIVNRLKLLSIEIFEMLSKILHHAKITKFYLNHSDREMNSISKLIDFKNSNIETIYYRNDNVEGTLDLNLFSKLKSLKHVRVHNKGNILNQNLALENFLSFDIFKLINACLSTSLKRFYMRRKRKNGRVLKIKTELLV